MICLSTNIIFQTLVAVFTKRVIIVKSLFKGRLKEDTILSELLAIITSK